MPPAAGSGDDAGAEIAREIPRLRWRCRRGMKELDLVLLGYLEGPWRAADAAQRRAFEELLALSDPEIMALLTGRFTADEPGLRRLVERLRAAP